MITLTVRKELEDYPNIKASISLYKHQSDAFILYVNPEDVWNDDINEAYNGVKQRFINMLNIDNLDLHQQYLSILSAISIFQVISLDMLVNRTYPTTTFYPIFCAEVYPDTAFDINKEYLSVIGMALTNIFMEIATGLEITFNDLVEAICPEEYLIEILNSNLIQQPEDMSGDDNLE